MTTPTVQDAIQAIASACDGAVDTDGVGFNGTDARFGRALSETPDAEWSPKMTRIGWTMVRKYRRQLEGHGIDYDAIPEPPDPTTDEGRAVLAVESPSEPRTVQVVLPGGGEGNDPAHYWGDPDVPLAVIRSEYDAALVDEIRNLPGRRWRADRKVNTVPLDKPEAVAALLAFSRAHGFDMDPALSEWTAKAEAELVEAEALAEELADLSGAMDSEALTIPGLTGTLRPYQEAAVRYISKARRTFLADEMGTGKTVMTLASLQYEDAYPAVIVVPAVAKGVWRRHVQDWLPDRTVEVLAGRTPPEGWTLTADVTVLNYDILKGWAPAFPTLGALVLDESHYVKEGKAQRTKAATELAATVPSDGLVLCLTGTPITNRPSELVAPLKLMGQLKPLGGWHEFVTRYCGAYKDRWGWDVSGATNMEELNAELKKRCYIRRTKADVLPDLPPKTWAEIPLNDHPKAPLAEYRRAEADVVEFLGRRAAEIAEALGEDPRSAAVMARLRAESAEHLVAITTLRRLAVKVKMGAVKEWVADFLEGSDKKLVVFAHHREAVAELAEAFQAPTISGGDTDRDAVVDRFQTDPECRVLVASIKAAGVALTLTAASDVLFVEQDWTPAGMDQAADRTHRIGQDNPVTAWVTIATDTVDEMMAGMLSRKRVVIDAVVDGVQPTEEMTSVLGDLVVALSQRG